MGSLLSDGAEKSAGYYNGGGTGLANRVGTSNCISWGDKKKRNNHGIVCIEGHYLCKQCTKTFIQTVISDQENDIEAKWSICEELLDPDDLKRCMNKSQINMYLMHESRMKLDKSKEKIMNCPYCEYFEVWKLNDSSFLFRCKQQKCMKVSWVVCQSPVRLKQRVSALITCKQSRRFHFSKYELFHFVYRVLSAL